MRILVTGGAGFIGSHVADAYIEEGHEVIIADDLSRGVEKNVNPKARFYRVDIRNRGTLARMFAETRPEVVSHHAAQVDVRRGVLQAVFDASVNILGSINILELSAEFDVRRIIYAGSAGASYGEPSSLFPINENCSPNPISPYGISKHTVEHYLFAYRALYGTEYVVLRYGNVFGPRQSSRGESGVWAIFCEQMLAGIKPTIYGDGTKVRDYVFVDDVVRANIASLAHGTREIFNIASGFPTTDYEVFFNVRRCLRKPSEEPVYKPRRPGEVEKIVLDISKARRLLNWLPVINLSVGAHRTVEYFMDQKVGVCG